MAREVAAGRRAAQGLFGPVARAIEARGPPEAPCSRTATCSASRRSSRADIEAILDLAESYVALNRRADKRADALQGLTQINMFFEASTRTQASFELAGKRLGADVMNMSVARARCARARR